jgi:hypothetical protein
MLLKPFPIKKGDPGVPIIDCTIRDITFSDTDCNTRSGINVMSKKVYGELFDDLPLYPIYIQL